MRKYIFKITLTEDQLQGDEFWEECIKEDPTGCHPLLDELTSVIEREFHIEQNPEDINIVQLVRYENGRLVKLKASNVYGKSNNYE